MITSGCTKKEISRFSSDEEENLKNLDPIKLLRSLGLVEGLKLQLSEDCRIDEKGFVQQAINKSKKVKK